MGIHNKWTPPQDARLRALRRDGASYDAMAAALGRSRVRREQRQQR